MDHLEYVQRIADEFCERKKISPVTVKLVDNFPLRAGATYSPIEKLIEIRPDKNEFPLRHELRHHYLREKTKGLSAIFGSRIVPYVSIACEGIGIYQGNDYLRGLSGTLWVAHFLQEAYADCQRGDLKHFAADLAMMLLLPLCMRYFPTR